MHRFVEELHFLWRRLPLLAFRIRKHPRTVRLRGTVKLRPAIGWQRYPEEAPRRVRHAGLRCRRCGFLCGTTCEKKSREGEEEVYFHASYVIRRFAGSSFASRSIAGRSEQVKQYIKVRQRDRARFGVPAMRDLLGGSGCCL